MKPTSEAPYWTMGWSRGVECSTYCLWKHFPTLGYTSDEKIVVNRCVEEGPSRKTWLVARSRKILPALRSSRPVFSPISEMCIPLGFSFRRSGILKVRATFRQLVSYVLEISGSVVKWIGREFITNLHCFLKENQLDKVKPGSYANVHL